MKSSAKRQTDLVRLVSVSSREMYEAMLDFVYMRMATVNSSIHLSRKEHISIRPYLDSHDIHDFCNWGQTISPLFEAMETHE